MCPIQPVPAPNDTSTDDAIHSVLARAYQLRLVEGDILIKLGKVDILVLPVTSSLGTQERVAELGGMLFPYPYPYPYTSPATHSHSLPHPQSLALAVFMLREGDGMRRTMCDVYCNSKWTPFGQLGVVIPPGGSMGMDDKLFVFPLPTENHSGHAAGVVRFEHGTLVREFRDLRANPRCALEYTFMDIRKILDTLNPGFAASPGTHIPGTEVRGRVILTGKPGESMAVPSIMADVLGLPVYTWSGEGGIIAAHRRDYLALEGAEYPSADSEQEKEELDVRTPTPHSASLEPEEDDIYIAAHAREHSGSSSSTTTATTTTTATESSSETLSTYPSSVGPTTPPSLPALRSLAIASRPLTPLDPSRLAGLISPGHTSTPGKSPPSQTQSQAQARKPTRHSPTANNSSSVTSPRPTARGVGSGHTRARSLSHSHSRGGSISRSLPPLREEEERGPTRTPTPTSTSALDVEPTIQILADQISVEPTASTMHASHTHGGGGELVLLARPSTATLIYTAMMPEFIRLQSLVSRRLVSLTGPWATVDHARKPMYEHHGSHGHSHANRPTTVTHMSMLYPNMHVQQPQHQHQHQHQHHGQTPLFSGAGEAGHSMAMSMGMGMGMGMGAGMGEA